MTQEELKLLAEWCGLKLEDETDAIAGITVKVYKKFSSPKSANFDRYEIWKPHQDSNQLDVLEDKMVEELQKKYERNFGYVELQIAYQNPFFVRIILVLQDMNDWEIGEGQGSTKNEARLNAIINYIRNLK